jgi:hypothetical protein
MNNDDPVIAVRTYEDLLAEKQRIERLIEIQKNIVRHDLDELKAEFKKEIKPATDVASFIQKVGMPKTHEKTFLKLATNVAIDLVFKSVFGRSNLLLRIFVPKLLKNYTSHYLQRLKLSGTKTPKRIN